jgi:anti-sigma regulatory factor (Ser/Thr protein kinase)
MGSILGTFGGETEMGPATSTDRGHPAFRHEALLYSGAEDFLDGTLSFIRDGIAGGESTLVVVSADKIRALRAELDGDADTVHFADMGEVGHNPARIIPAWRDFLDQHGGKRPARGVGEPIWAGRSPAELVECQRHESLLNLAFADSDAWRLLCPYDVDALPPAVIEEAHRSHPIIQQAGTERASTRYRDLDAMAPPFDIPLPDPPHDAVAFPFEKFSLAALRQLVGDEATAAGFDPAQVDGVVLAVHEAAANSVRHGGGRGLVRIWREGSALVFDIRDRGHIDDPLVGRRRPPMHGANGRGIWMMNQLCDLVQLRSIPTGNVVRLHIRPTADVALSS